MLRRLVKDGIDALVHIGSSRREEEFPLRFRVESSEMPYSAVLELDSDGGMLFSTPEGRETFFKRADNNPEYVNYWSALSHARGTNLGVFGSSDSLYRDCSRIMAYEIRRVQERLGITPDITGEEVEYSRFFRTAYNAAREPKKAALHNFVRSLGSNRQHMDEMKPQLLDQRASEQMQYLHFAVLVELGRITIGQADWIFQKGGFGKFKFPYEKNFSREF